MTKNKSGNSIFWSRRNHGFARLAVAVPEVAIADPNANALAIIRDARAAAEAEADIILFPELSLSGYSSDELFFQRPLLDGVEDAAWHVARALADVPSLVVAGAPLAQGGRLYNCALIFHAGRIIGAVPKTYLPNYREFYEKRYFASGSTVPPGATVCVAGEEVPFGTDLIFKATGDARIAVGIEICEDVWVPVPPSSLAALAGATILLNLSASNITVGKGDARKLLCASHSARTVSAYAYAAAGAGESTTDLAWDGHALIYENGKLLAEGDRFSDTSQTLIADIDVEALVLERMRLGSWGDCADGNRKPFRSIPFTFDSAAVTQSRNLKRPQQRYPFVPDDAARRDQDCYEAYNIQVRGLITRLQATGIRKVVIGISGGLDSTHALVVCARAMDRLGLPRTNILAYTMPGFGTSARTLDSAWTLMKAFGVTASEIGIADVAKLTLKDIGHPVADGDPQYDITYENVQAGARTAYLFRLANLNNALVIGTGDLSELALGWCTYGVGDHMSHYGVNAGVPKTMIQHLIRWVAERGEFGEAASGTLRAVLATEISPELLPLEQGRAVQRTEDIIGPYALQDFNLFYTVRHGFAPSKVAFLAWHAWHDASAGTWPEGMQVGDKRSYDLAEIRKWLRVFLTRFFQTSQFKRSALPNGPKVLPVSLSPRGDWRAPSDASARLWIDELERHVPESG